MGNDDVINRFEEPIERLRRLSRQIDAVRLRIAENKHLIWRENEADAAADDHPAPAHDWVLHR
jgi:hypothetical protein